MKHGIPMRWTRQRGISLLEILVTLLVATIGLVGLAGLQVITLKSNHTALIRSQASSVVYEIADFARANRSRVIASGSLPNVDFWRAHVRELLGPDSDIQVAVGSDDSINITVSWKDSRNADASGDGPDDAAFMVGTRI